MWQTSIEKSKKNGYQSDDENIRYKINTEFFDNATKTTSRHSKKSTILIDDDEIRYKLPTNSPPQKSKPLERKPKSKPKIKVNFWSNKQSVNRINKPEDCSDRRHTVGGVVDNLVPKSKGLNYKVRKQVSFLPSPLFSDNHIPMVTVPDDLTIQLNEEEANDLAKDLNLGSVKNKLEKKPDETSKRKARPTTQNISKDTKRKRSSDDIDLRSQGNENELEFFSKYVVQKLRRMETNQRIYSENLINTVLMLGQLGKLNGKSKISEA